MNVNMLSLPKLKVKLKVHNNICASLGLKCKFYFSL